jgi:hypothetical protein
VEGYINARQRDGCKTALELDVAFCSLLLLGALEAFHHDVTEHLFNLLDGELLSPLYKLRVSCNHFNRMKYKPSGCRSSEPSGSSTCWSSSEEKGALPTTTEPTIIRPLGHKNYQTINSIWMSQKAYSLIACTGSLPEQTMWHTKYFALLPNIGCESHSCCLMDNEIS